MVSPTLFTAITPTLSGATFTFTAASASGTGDLVPVAVGSGMTVVLIKNADGVNSHTATFVSQTTAPNITVTIPKSTTAAVQLSPPSRWANSAAENTCIVTYDSNTNLSLAVLNVPWQSV